MKWETYYDKFYDLSPKAKLDCGLRVTEFPRSDEVLEIAYELDELINFCDKELNRLLVFRHLDYFADTGPDYLDLYMYKKDFKRFKREIGYVSPPPPKKIGFFTQLAIAILGVQILDEIFDDD